MGCQYRRQRISHCHSFSESEQDTPVLPTDPFELGHVECSQRIGFKSLRTCGPLCFIIFFFLFPISWPLELIDIEVRSMIVDPLLSS